MTKGGDGGWCIVDLDAWVLKMKVKRKGKTPAAGMQHSEENKNLFSEVSRAYWDTQDTYKPEEILTLRFTEANRKYGVSKTHYYRLRKLYGSKLSWEDEQLISRYKKSC